MRHGSNLFTLLRLHTVRVFEPVFLADTDGHILFTPCSHTILSYGDGEGALCCTRGDEYTDTRNVNRSECETTPSISFGESTLPFRARHLVIRGLLLVGPDSLDDIRTCVLAICCVEKQFQDKEACARRD